MSGEVVLMTLLGGMGTVFGPIAGAFVILAMENYLSNLGAWVTITQGVVFVICVLAFRRGILGELEALLKRRLTFRQLLFVLFAFRHHKRSKERGGP